jgi:hypothetical protein
MYRVKIKQGYRFANSSRDAELDFIELTDNLMWAADVDIEHNMVNVYKELYRKTIYSVIDTDYVVVPCFYSDDEEWTRVFLLETDMIDDGDTYIIGYTLPEGENQLTQDLDNDVINICTLEDWHEL